MKKLYGLVVYGFIFSIILVLGGCSSDELLEGNGEIFVDKEWKIYDTEHSLTKPIEINFWSSNSAVDIQGSTMADMVQQFNDYQKNTYPDSNIKVNVSFQGGYVNQNTKLQAALVGGTNPEIAMVGVSSLALYVDNIIDMRKIFSYDEIREIYEGLLQFSMYQHKFIGYPYFAATNLFLVNRTLAEASDMKVPTTEEIIADPENSIWTWDYMKELAKSISNSEDGIYGLGANGPALYESFYTQGVAIYNESATKQTFNNEAGVKSFEYWRSLVSEGAMLNPVLDPNHGTKIQGQFSAGEIGLLWGSSSVIKSIYENVYTNKVAIGEEPTFDLDVLPFPKNSEFYSNQSGGGLVVFNDKSEAKTKAAIEFLRWLQAPEQSAYFSIHTGYLPTTPAATETTTWKEYSSTNPLLDKVLSLMVFPPSGDLKLPIGRAKALADDDFAKYVKGIYYDDLTRDIQEVLDQCADRVQYVLESNSW